VLPAGTIGDYVWRDLDGQGDQDPGEPGVSGVTVQLTPPAGVDLGAGAGNPITTVTDSSGYYLFTGLPASGSYTVAVLTATLPGGTGTPTYDYDGTGTPNSTVVTLDHDATNGDDTMLGADFGYTLPSLIRGTVWHDLDRDHAPAPESGEDRLGGITVRLYQSDGTTLITTTTTAADGTYKFTGAYNGTYVVKVDDTTGPLGTGTWTDSYDTDGIGTADQVTVTVAAGGEAVADYSYYLTGAFSLGDTLFIDWNGNGTQDAGDIGISGSTLLLYQDENTNGVIDAEDALVGSMSTDANGYYLFTSLPAGSYQLTVDRTSPGFPTLYNRTADPDGILDDRSSVLLTADDDLQDFGYQPYGFNSIGDTVWYDSNGDGIQSGVTETGIAGATVRLSVDYNNDGNWVQISSQVTDANGNYLFTALPDSNYRVTVDSTGAGIPDDAFGNDWSPTTATSFEIAASGGNAYLDADFGFAPLGAIGDTIYWDNNGNGDQDWGEPGVPGVTVNLYLDKNNSGVLDDGDTLAATQNTDSNGNYLFTELAAGNYVVDVVDGSGPLAGTPLTADPENDGLPCPIPAVAGPSCDGQTGVQILPGTFFMGADFGYLPPGVIGDFVWIDLNTNGLFDVGEQGIPYVPVVLYSGLGTTTPVATNYTDGDGYYSFGNLADGVYTVAVLTNDVNNPFPPNLTASYDADGTPDNTANKIRIYGGHITEINDTLVSNADLTIDFGYRYAGSNSLSGTIGLDDDTYDGLMNGTNPSGPGPGEFAFASVSVNLLLWSDDGDDLVQAGEYTTIATTSTDANGDYSFENLPSGVTGDRYIVSISAPRSELRLTTEVTDTAATILVNTTNLLGYTTAVYQVVPIVLNQQNIDFAFKADSTILRDYGDLPVSYSTTIAEQPVGPSHTIVDGQPLYLGSGVDEDPNGQPSPTATADTNEDGVQVSGLQWTEGAAGGSVTVTVGAGAGWLVGWIDFNQDGTFTNANEQVFALAVDSAVNGGVYQLSFDIPSNTFSTVDATYLNARFRLYAAKPLLATFFGDAVGGDVEDYQFVRGIAGNYVWEDLNGNGIQEAGELGLSNVVVRLYQSDGTTLVEQTTTAADGSYIFKGLQPAEYIVQVEQPALTLFTTQDAAANDSLDSDFDSSGFLAVSLLADPVRDDVDAGVYVPAQLYGYLFEDEDDNLLRNSGDTSITNALVTLTVNGIIVATTNTDEWGYYFFGDIPVGAATVLVSQVNANLIDVPPTTDESRNRAVSNTVDTAMIVYPVISGYGVLSTRPGEQLNFGFDVHPLSTAISLKVYAAADGRVMIEIATVNENGNNDIEIYAMIDGDWVLVANVPSEQIVGFGSNLYTVEAFGLTPGESYRFRIVDESGHIFESDPITVALSPLLVEAVTLTPELIKVAFNTEYGLFYQIMVCEQLGAPWVVEYVQYPTARGWSALSNEPFMAGPGDRTEVLIPRNNRPQAFFRIIKIQ